MVHNYWPFKDVVNSLFGGCSNDIGIVIFSMDRFVSEAKGGLWWRDNMEERFSISPFTGAEIRERALSRVSWINSIDFKFLQREFSGRRARI